MSTNPFGVSAADACKVISSKAQDIAAQFSGAADLVSKAEAFLNPSNYKSGDNTTNNTLRNIINTQLTTSDITKVQNDCKNASTSLQSNTLDTTNCPFCQQHGCNITGNTQTNQVSQHMMCSAQSAVQSLMSNGSSVDAQAAAQAVQKAVGLLSGANTATNDVCQQINTNMSSSSYVQQLTNCANTASVDQSNTIAACGSISNNIQANQIDQTYNCVAGSTTSQTVNSSSTAKAGASASASQSTEGVTLWGSMGSSIVCAVVLAIVAFFAYKMISSPAVKTIVIIIVVLVILALIGLAIWKGIQASQQQFAYLEIEPDENVDISQANLMRYPTVVNYNQYPPVVSQCKGNFYG